MFRLHSPERTAFSLQTHASPSGECNYYMYCGSIRDASYMVVFPVVTASLLCSSVSEASLTWHHLLNLSSSDDWLWNGEQVSCLQHPRTTSLLCLWKWVLHLLYYWGIGRGAFTREALVFNWEPFQWFLLCCDSTLILSPSFSVPFFPTLPPHLPPSFTSLLTSTLPFSLPLFPPSYSPFPSPLSSLPSSPPLLSPASSVFQRQCCHAYRQFSMAICDNSQKEVREW